jgi:NAD(P)-dependent dehydrogenase (short-subunit alcohol dehydrogenase family)
VAELLHHQGYRVALCGRRKKEGLDNAAKLDSSGDTAIFIQCDVAVYKSQEALFELVWDKWQRLDIVIANAGVVDRASKYNLGLDDALPDQHPKEPDMTCTDINLKGSIFTIDLAIHHMRRNPGGKGGQIIVTSSVLGIYPNPTFPEYCAAKAGLNQYVRSMASVLLTRHHITINCVLPGPIETEVMLDFTTAFPTEHMTLKSTLMRCFDLYIKDVTKKTGETMEVGHNIFIMRDGPMIERGTPEECWAGVFEPWFKVLHGSESGLPHTNLSRPQA